MESDSFRQFFPFIRKNLLIVIIASLGLICLGYGLIALLGSSNSADDITIQSQTDGLSGNTSVNKIKADIEGAVVDPGVYELGFDSRIQDLLVAGKGLSATADRDWVAKNLNLAAKLSDGAKVYIPVVGESIQVSNQLGIASSGSININVAGIPLVANLNMWKDSMPEIVIQEAPTEVGSTSPAFFIFKGDGSDAADPFRRAISTVEYPGGQLAIADINRNRKAEIFVMYKFI